MPLEANRLSANRANFRHSLSRSEIATLVSDQRIRVLQTSEPVDSGTWADLNTHFFSIRPDVELRVYGFYSSVCDLSFLSIMGNVRSFSADCLIDVKNLQAITRLPSLRSIGVGVYNLEDFSFLADLPTDIEEIGLGATRSRKPSIRHLERFHKLKTLSLEGQRKDIEVISSLLELEDLTIRSITVDDLSFLRPLSKLWSLDIKLGGSSNLTGIAGLANIKYLELWQVKALSDLEAISTLSGLQYLFLQALPQVKSLPDFSRLTKLRKIYLENMKGLRDISVLCSAPALEQLTHSCARQHNPIDYKCLLAKPTMKIVQVGFGSDRKNNALKAMLKDSGKVWDDFTPFAFH